MSAEIKISDVADEIEKLVNISQQVNRFQKIIDHVKEINFFSDEATGKIVDRKVAIIKITEHLFEAAERAESGFTKINGGVFFYNDNFWQTAAEDELKTALLSVARKTGYPHYNATYFRFIDDLYKQFLLLAPSSQPQTSPHNTLINLLNGTYEIGKSNALLRRFEKEDFLTYQLQFEYKPNQDAPKFMAFLNEVLPDLNSQHIIAEFIAYSFTKNLKLEKAILLYGNGANGKSVIFEIVNALLGTENISNFPLSSLASESYKARIANKLMNYASELEDKIDRTIFKVLVSGEKTNARNLYGSPFIIENYAKLWFNANKLPSNPEITEVFFRRLLIIPFSITIPTEKRNPNLAKEIIETELSGIFNWVLEGLQRIRINKQFSRSQASENIIEDYKISSDSVRAFIEECEYIIDLGKGTLLRDLYKEYQAFCNEGGMYPLSKQNFNQRLKDIGIQCKRNGEGNRVFVTKKVLI